MAGKKKLRQLCAVSGNKANKFWETLVEGTSLPFRVPDEMTDAERSEIFTGIPRGEARKGSPTLVLPNAFADSLGVGRRNIDRGRSGSRDATQENR